MSHVQDYGPSAVRPDRRSDYDGTVQEAFFYIFSYPNRDEPDNIVRTSNRVEVVWLVSPDDDPTDLQVLKFNAFYAGKILPSKEVGSDTTNGPPCFGAWSDVPELDVIKEGDHQSQRYFSQNEFFASLQQGEDSSTFVDSRKGKFFTSRDNRADPFADKTKYFALTEVLSRLSGWEWENLDLDREGIDALYGGKRFHFDNVLWYVAQKGPQTGQEVTFLAPSAVLPELEKTSRTTHVSDSPIRSKPKTDEAKKTEVISEGINEDGYLRIHDSLVSIFDGDVKKKMNPVVLAAKVAEAFETRDEQMEVLKYCTESGFSELVDDDLLTTVKVHGTPWLKLA